MPPVADAIHQRQLSGLRWIVIAFVAFWVGYSAYTIWSYNNVFPVSEAKLIKGNVELSLPVLPFDAYGISFLSHYGETTQDTAFRRIRELNAREPIVYSVSVLRGGAEALSQSGSTHDWGIGSRPPFSPAMRFRGDMELYSSGPKRLEFVGNPFRRYTIRLDIDDIGGVAREYPTTILVAGNRDDGYYPLKPILLLMGSVPLFLVLAIVQWLMARSCEHA